MQGCINMSLTHYSQKNKKSGLTTCYNLDAAGAKQGIYLEYRKDCTINVLGHYLNDKLHGAFTVYSPNGTLCLSQNFKDGQLDGVVTEFKSNNHICMTYTNGVMTDKKIYDNVYGRTKVLREHYKFNLQGQLDGEQTKYFSDGCTPSQLSIYTADQLVSERYYRTNGTVKTEKTKTQYGYKTVDSVEYYYFLKTTVVEDTSAGSETKYIYEPRARCSADKFFTITRNQYRDRCPKELYDAIKEECVTRTITVNGQTVQHKIDQERFISDASRAGDTVTFEWRFTKDVYNTIGKKKHGKFVREEIELTANYSLITDKVTLSRNVLRREEKNYVDNRAFGFFKTTVFSPSGKVAECKEYFRAGARNVNHIEAIDAFGKTDNSQFTKADVAFITLKYN